MFVKIQNEGENDFVIEKGMKIVQGIFTKFLTVDNEGDIDNIRNGGLGSTGK